ncbi:DUF4175 family protein [Gaetbulibacter sp. M240]|uniref:DUF4175 family protein n=1 Tax=Gaetbulibacter sp. M240 TaxID=3126511 RepID=UPI00374F0C24
MNSHFKNIEHKLEAFITRYYINVLLKGLILFFSIWTIYVLTILFIENVLWLGTTARTILFWTCVVVSFVLLAYFILIPLAKLVKLQKGINYKDAAVIIGNQFPEVNDKLLNVLQLHESAAQSELVLASIDQKAIALEPIPFRNAINLKGNIKYLKYTVIPLVIVLLVWISGNLSWFSDSYTRVVHYKTAYEPPAPFQFFVLNDALETVQNKTFTLRVNTAGTVVPERVEIEFNNQTYSLKQTGPGAFEYAFRRPFRSLDFVLSANKVVSKTYTLKVIEAPTLLGFDMTLDYPSYTKKPDATLKGSGNATVPEGTKINWTIGTNNTETVHFYAKDTVAFKVVENDVFSFEKDVRTSFDYMIAASNKNLKDYESLNFNIVVVKDAFPEISMRSEVDSLNNDAMYFYGQVRDDYGLSALKMVYYPLGKTEVKREVPIMISPGTIGEFFSAFPESQDVLPGTTYEIYFQVTDNDQVNGSKTSRSNTFVFRKNTVEELENQQLEQQRNTIKSIDKSLDGFEKQEKALEEFSKTQKEKRSLNFNDKKKLERFLERQKQQDALMKRFNKNFQENVNNLDREDDNIFKEDLENRLKENEAQLERDEKLLDELNKIKDKIAKEDLTEKLDELAKRNKNKKRSLEQLLELTKRFYVQKKLDQLTSDLEKLAEDQEKLSEEKTDNSSEKQKALNERFDEFKEALEDLEKDSKDLRKPISIPRDVLDENAIQNDQKEALESLSDSEEEKKESGEVDPNNNAELNKAREQQKRAAAKMKELKNKMESRAMSMSQEQLQEDTEMLRQILDNVVVFSFDQEELMKSFENSSQNDNKFASFLLKQNDLKTYFEHVDDSLFALSLRQPKLSETVNKNITDVYYNIDKALDLFSEADVYQGVSRQQFAVTAANNLSDFLSDVLDNMEENLSMSSGQSGEGDMQLPDIIMSQEELNKMMQEGMKNSDDGKPQNKGGEKEGNEPSEGSEGDNKGSSGTNEGGDEMMNGLLYEIYQRQQELRQALQDKMSKQGLGKDESNVLDQMEEVESDLLNNGFNNETLQKMLDLKHELLKLDSATFLQGEDNSRESKTNGLQFENTVDDMTPKSKRFFNSLEILNKQALPLQENYKKKVQDYFKERNDSI